jgi:glycosyltransferase involved in cell wall biosynthesis
MSDKQKQMVVFTGSLLEKKGIFSLVKAWNLVYKEKPEAQLYIFGKGEVYDLKALLNENALKSVCFMGHTPRDVIYDYLLKATLAIFPSYSETFGFCAVEAMSVGCPTIYTKRSCGPEIVRENVDGLLVDPDDIEEIAEKIIKLIDDKVLRHKFSIQGRKSVIERFNIEKSAKEHIKFYQNIITNYNN